MAHRTFKQFRYSFERMPVDLFLKAAIGGTGAVTLDATNSTGTATMTRTSAGLYVITLQDAYSALLAMSVCQTLAGATCTAAPDWKVTSVSSASGVTVITLQFQGPTNSSTTTPVATDPDSGVTLNICMTLRNQ